MAHGAESCLCQMCAVMSSIWMNPKVKWITEYWVSTNISQQTSRHQRVTDNIVSHGRTSYHTSRKRESTNIDNNNRSSKRGTQIIQYVTSINDGVSKTARQAYTNAIHNEVQGECCDQSSVVKRKKKHSQNNGSLQEIPWSSYKAISPFLGTFKTTETLQNYTNNSRETQNRDNLGNFASLMIVLILNCPPRGANFYNMDSSNKQFSSSGRGRRKSS